MANVKLTKIAIKFGLQILFMSLILLTSAHAIFVIIMPSLCMILSTIVNYHEPFECKHDNK